MKEELKGKEHNGPQKQKTTLLWPWEIKKKDLMQPFQQPLVQIEVCVQYLSDFKA